jgi:hypothetical protein
MEIPYPPASPKKLKEYLLALRELAMTVQPIAGRNVSISVQKGKGTVVNAEDCPPCPPP